MTYAGMGTIIEILLEMVLISTSIHRVFIIDRFLYCIFEFIVSPHAGCMSKSIVVSIEKCFQCC